MAEKVLIASVRSPNRAVLMDVRLARLLVSVGAYGYVTEQSPEPAPVKPAHKKAEKTEPKKRTYKRRDMKAEG